MKIERKEEKKKTLYLIYTQRVVAVYVKNDVKNIVNTHLHTVDVFLFVCDFIRKYPSHFNITNKHIHIIFSYYHMIFYHR